jgi:hypothetical protein
MTLRGFFVHLRTVGYGPQLPTCALQQIVSFRGNTRRVAGVAATAESDPDRKSSRLKQGWLQMPDRVQAVRPRANDAAVRKASYALPH